MAALEVDNFKREQERLNKTMDDTNSENQTNSDVTQNETQINQTDNSEKSHFMETLKCKEHSEDLLLEDPREGTVVCSACGLVVIDQLVCESGEWRTFGDDGQNEKWKRSRVGGVAHRFLSNGTNLNTTIRTDRNSNCRSGFNSTVIKLFQRKHIDNGVIHAMKQLEEMANRIHLPARVLEFAQQIYSQMYHKCNFKGIKLFADAKIGACLFIACFHTNCARTISEICAITEAEHNAIERAVRRISRILKLPIGRISGGDLVPRYCGWLSLPREISQQASEIANVMSESDKKQEFLVETIAASAIFFTTVSFKLEKYKRTQSDIARCLGITPNLIRSCCQHFVNELDELYSA